ncbi:MAG: aldo/keto reductase [Verrucomicrobia bacterium]|nr:aldo/keto reductase [Verrucomicrobiota bacterium]
MIPYCQSNGITIVAYSPLSRQIQHLKDADPHGVLDGLARETGRTMAQIALNWCLSHPGVCVIPKGSSAEHVVDNCGASGWRLSRDQLQRLNTGIASCRRGWVEQRLRVLASGRLRPIVLKFRPLLPPAIRRKLQ